MNIDLQDHLLTRVCLNISRDPNLLGEILRADTFPLQDIPNFLLGCYGTFEVSPFFRRIEITEETYNLYVHNKLSGISWDEWNNEIPEWQSNPVIYKHISLPDYVCAWFWDGDGSLYFKYGDYEVVNHDCKHTNYWEFLDEDKLKEMIENEL